MSLLVGNLNDAVLDEVLVVDVSASKVLAHRIKDMLTCCLHGWELVTLPVRVDKEGCVDVEVATHN